MARWYSSEIQRKWKLYTDESINFAHETKQEIRGSNGIEFKIFTSKQSKLYDFENMLVSERSLTKLFFHLLKILTLVPKDDKDHNIPPIGLFLIDLLNDFSKDEYSILQFSKLFNIKFTDKTEEHRGIYKFFINFKDNNIFTCWNYSFKSHDFPITYDAENNRCIASLPRIITKIYGFIKEDIAKKDSYDLLLEEAKEKSKYGEPLPKKRCMEERIQITYQESVVINDLQEQNSQMYQQIELLKKEVHDLKRSHSVDLFNVSQQYNPILGSPYYHQKPYYYSQPHPLIPQHSYFGFQNYDAQLQEQAKQTQLQEQAVGEHKRIIAKEDPKRELEFQKQVAELKRQYEKDLVKYEVIFKSDSLQKSKVVEKEEQKTTLAIFPQPPPEQYKIPSIIPKKGILKKTKVSQELNSFVGDDDFIPL